MQGFLTGYQTNKDKIALGESSGDASSSKALFSKSSNQSSTATEKPWVEKYRPKTIDDIAHQEEAVKVRDSKGKVLFKNSQKLNGIKLITPFSIEEIKLTLI